jgi:transcriptional regulator GlxA family with amidase domain
VAGTEASVRTGHGLCLATEPLTDLGIVPDLVVMPAVGCGLKSSRQVVDIVRNHPVLAHVTALHIAGSALAAACTGTFFLAEAGVLDGLLATTSWWLGPAFRRRYTAVRLDESQTLARDGRVTTAGAAFAHIDLALSIVAQESPALADMVARYLLIGDRPSQAIFAVPSHLAAKDPTMTAFERWVADRLRPRDPPGRGDFPAAHDQPDGRRHRRGGRLPEHQHTARPGPAAARHHPQRAAPDSPRPLITWRRAVFGARRCRARTPVPRS